MVSLAILADLRDHYGSWDADRFFPVFYLLGHVDIDENTDNDHGPEGYCRN